MIRVLQVYPQMNNAGTEMVMMNWYRNIDRSKIQFDFLTEKPGVLDDEIISLGGKVYYIPFENKKDYYDKLVNFFSMHKEYKIIHTHTHKLMGFVLKVANDCKIPFRISHSHNSRQDLPKISKLYKVFQSRPIEKYSTHFFACSEEAGKWLYPIKNKRCKVINNAIDLEKFKFNSTKRKKIRDSFGINDTTKVICHVGRFSRQKNHDFLIDIFNDILSENKNVVLLLAGIGPLIDKIKDKVKDLNLEKKVYFLGNRNDINEILSASDLFLFPSLHEGLGIVLIEAQASGLQCLATDSIPKIADIGEQLLSLESLDNDSRVWARSALTLLDKSYDRSKVSQNAMNCNYNIKEIANYIENFYINLLESL